MQNLRSSLLLCTMVSTASFARAQSVMDPAWVHDSGTEGWLPKVASLGARGTQAITQFGPGSDKTRFLSGFADGSVGAHWQRTESVSTYAHHVASAEEGDLHVTLHSQLAVPGPSYQLVLRRFGSSSENPRWSAVLPTPASSNPTIALAVSRNGQRIVTLAHNSSINKADLSVFGPDSATPLRQGSYVTNGTFRGIDLSADGTRLAVASDLRIQVIDLDTGAIAWSVTPFESMHGTLALSGNGEWLSYGATGACRLFQRTSSGTYVQVLNRVFPGNSYCGKVDLSDDGSTLAAAFNMSNSLGIQDRVAVEVYDIQASLLAGSLQPVHRHETPTPTIAVQNIAADLECSADGRVVAAGTWGDAAGPLEEVVVFRRNEGYGAWRVALLPGSVFDIDLSGDGRALLVASKAAHANLLASGGRLSQYDLSGGDLEVANLPVSGGTLRIVAHGTPYTATQLFTSPLASANPQLIGSLGRLYLRRSMLTAVLMPPFDGNGVSALDLPLPSWQYPPGSTFYIQSLMSTPRKLSSDWVQITVLP